MTVAEAMIAYITDFKARGGRTLKDTEATIKAHILPTLGNKRIDALTFTAVKQWHHRVAVARKPPLNGKSGFTILDSPDAITMNRRGVTEHRIMASDELLGAQFPSRDLIAPIGAVEDVTSAWIIAALSPGWRCGGRGDRRLELPLTRRSAVRQLLTTHHG